LVGKTGAEVVETKGLPAQGLGYGREEAPAEAAADEFQIEL
jgi:hypothetical protein